MKARVQREILIVFRMLFDEFVSDEADETISERKAISTNPPPPEQGSVEEPKT